MGRDRRQRLLRARIKIDARPQLQVLFLCKWRSMNIFPGSCLRLVHPRKVYLLLQMVETALLCPCQQFMPCHAIRHRLSALRNLAYDLPSHQISTLRSKLNFRSHLQVSSHFKANWCILRPYFSWLIKCGAHRLGVLLISGSFFSLVLDLQLPNFLFSATTDAMQLNLKILNLPASLLFLLASHIISTNAAQGNQSPAQLQWNPPIQAKRWPADSPQRRRQLEAVQEHLRLGRSPVGVLKMSDDEGEKFYMEYWQFEGELEESWLSDASTSLRARDEEEEARLLANSSAIVSFRPPFAFHREDGSSPLSFEDLKARKGIEGRNAADFLAVLERRGFVCPTGTADCSGISQPNYCCPTTETCFAIQDTGLGPVGCCPNGSTCGGTISGCNAPNSPCDDSLGGACCIPNYVCAGVGCKSS
jgi:hypothetical protein